MRVRRWYWFVCADDPSTRRRAQGRWGVLGTEAPRHCSLVQYLKWFYVIYILYMNRIIPVVEKVSHIYRLGLKASTLFSSTFFPRKTWLRRLMCPSRPVLLGFGWLILGVIGCLTGSLSPIVGMSPKQCQVPQPHYLARTHNSLISAIIQVCHTHGRTIM